jgi:hypothetical protein
MPNFDQETIEEWQLKTALEVCEYDLQAEEARLQEALAYVKASRSNIRSLKKKKENILRRINETR